MKTKPIKKMKIMYPCILKDSNGSEFEWTEADLKEVAKNYSCSSPEKGAPIVLSHKTEGQPRYGYIESAWFDETEKALFCSAQVSEKLYEYVKNGSFPNRSIAVYPKSKKIQHLAILGAEEPAFENLGLAEFCKGEENEEVLTYSIWVENGDLSGAINERITSLEKEFTEIKNLLNNISKMVKGDNSQPATFSKPDAVGAFGGSGSAVARLEAENAALRAEKENRVKEDAANFTKSLLENQQISPNLKGMFEEKYLSEYSKGTDALAAFKSECEKYPKILSGILPESTNSGDKSSVQKITEAALAYQKSESEKGITIDFKTAVTAVRKD